MSPSPSKAVKAVLKHLATQGAVSLKQRTSHSPNSNNNMNSNKTVGYVSIFYHKPYYRKVIKKNGKWAPHPTNKKYYIKKNGKFFAPEYVPI
jgi:hypothetical protein